MATSPIYSWPEPDNTDLVKNGALAIRTMGDAIDTTMATMTPKSTFTAKGSIAAATAASTPANLSVGANGTLLTADSGATAGLSYQPNYASGKNKCLNSDMSIAQRGTSINMAASGYLLDRYYHSVAAAVPTGTVSQQTFTPGTAPVAGYEYKNFMRVNVTANNGCTLFNLSQAIEDVRTLAGQTATFSFWAKADGAATFNGAFIQQGFGTGGSGGVNTALTLSSSAVLGTSWVRYTATVNVPSVAGKTIGANSSVSLLLQLPNSGGTLRNGTYDFFGWQLEAGSVATAFQTATGTIQGELAACQRYYWRINSNAANQYAVFANSGYIKTITTLDLNVQAPVAMRVVPSSIDFANLSAQDTLGTIISCSGLALADLSTNITFGVNATTSGAVAGRGIRVLANASAAAYLGFSAEL